MILTIGHSVHPIQEFIELLQAHGVKQLFDIRTVPKSRRNPQFHTDALAASLEAAGIRYSHFPELGGLRHPRKDSINSAWKNDSFRGYADYMQTPEFDQGIRKLIDAESQCSTVIMCAEAVPWRCHRSLVADALIARGVAVEHILSKSSRKPHTVTSFAKMEGEKVTYPGLL